MKNIPGQIDFLKEKNLTESELGVQVSYIIASQKIAAESKLFTDVEYLKECTEAASEIVYPLQKSLFYILSLTSYHS